MANAKLPVSWGIGKVVFLLAYCQWYLLFYRPDGRWCHSLLLNCSVD